MAKKIQHLWLWVLKIGIVVVLIKTAKMYLSRRITLRIGQSTIPFLHVSSIFCFDIEESDKNDYEMDLHGEIDSEDDRSRGEEVWKTVLINFSCYIIGNV